MKFAVIHGYRGEYPIAEMCRVFDVSKAGYYTWKQQAQKRLEIASRRSQLKHAVKVVHLGSKENYGSPRIHDRVSGLGHPVSQSTVARVMRRQGIRSRLKRKFKATTDSNHKLPVAPNHLLQDFTAYVPNQIWMSDITYVATGEGWLYVCAVIDLFSRKIVGWAASSRMTQDLVMAAYLRARLSRTPGKRLIFHSDRGSQYAASRFRKMLNAHGVIQSMSRRANCWDSAPIESFWHTLKTEHVYWQRYGGRQEALLSIRPWIEIEYNQKRAHSSLRFMSPVEFESLKKEVTSNAKIV